MRNRFDAQLDKLYNSMVELGELCRGAISLSVEATLGDESGDIDALRHQVFLTDAEIDHMEREIETLCMKLLLQQQPVARDLRVISSALKMISDMERIGDQASDIAELAEYVQAKNVRQKLHLRQMADEAIRMVADSVESFVKKDLALAAAVIAYDDVVDSLFAQVKAELISLIAADSQNGELYMDLLMIAKYFERIGDHATNIAEWVEYSITGVHRTEEDQ